MTVPGSSAKMWFIDEATNCTVRAEAPVLVHHGSRHGMSVAAAMARIEWALPLDGTASSHPRPEFVKHAAMVVEATRYHRPSLTALVLGLGEMKVQPLEAKNRHERRRDSKRKP